MLTSTEPLGVVQEVFANAVELALKGAELLATVAEVADVQPFTLVTVTV